VAQGHAYRRCAHEAEFRAALAAVTSLQFRAEFSNSVDTGSLDNARLSLYTVALPAPRAVCSGEQVQIIAELTSGAENGPYTLRWRKDGAPMDAIANPSVVTLLLDLGAAAVGDAGRYDLLITSACGEHATAAAQLMVDPADVGVPGGVPGHDGTRDNNDFVVFIDAFFGQRVEADVGSQGGQLGSDDAFDNNDFVVFIDQFFTEC